MDRDEALKLLSGGADGVKEWNRLRGEDKEIPELSGAELSGADLADADLSDADLSGANLRRAKLENANLYGANLSRANLSGANLSDANLRDANLRDANLRDANLSNADLRGANLTHANLRDANLSDANLSDANLNRAKLENANLYIANLSGAILYGANLSYANLSNADLRGANLTHANLSDANLSDANLSDANLSDANLNRAKLENANLYGPNLSRANLSGANLRDANLRDANLRDANLRDANLRNADLRGANLENANFSGADLSGASLYGAYSNDTVWGNLDLSLAKNLDTIMHFGPSVLGVETIIKSRGKVPQSFLEGCGVPDNWITYLPSLLGQPIDFCSCFISYSHEDEEFSKRLHSRMREDKLRVWYAPEDMKSGRKTHEQIDTAIRLHDKLLVVLSEQSMQSEWVKTEIWHVRQREVKEGKRVLFPIRMVSMEAIKKWKAFDEETGKDMAREIRSYSIPDFTDWKDHDSFEESYQRLMKDFKPSPDDG